MKHDRSFHNLGESHPIPLTRKRERTPTLSGPERSFEDPRIYLERKEWLHEIEIGSAILPDSGKERCEDDAYSDMHVGVACVCDGVGSGIAGDVAAKTVTNIVRHPEQVSDTEIKPLFAEREVPSDQKTIELLIRKFLEYADRSVRETFDTLPVQQMLKDRFVQDNIELGSEEAQDRLIDYRHNHLTTCAFVKNWRSKDGNEFISIGNIGDSRLYRRRKGTLERLTSDDTMVEPFRKYGVIQDNGDLTQTITLQQITDLLEREDIDEENFLRALTLKQMLEAKEITETTIGDITHLVLNSLGIERTTQHPFYCEIRTEPIEEGDELYLCSDGIENYTDQELEDFLEFQHADQGDTQQLCQNIILHGANLDRKLDDFTVIVMRYTKGKFQYTKEHLDKKHPPL